MTEVKEAIEDYKVLEKENRTDFPSGPIVKNPPSNWGDTSSIPDPRTKIPHVAGQLSPDTTATEPVCSRAHTPPEENPACCY